MFMILLLAADPTGRFDKEGQRLQEVAYRTIAEWEKMATTARSKQRRAEGAHAVLRVCLLKHKTPLTEEEKTAAENVAIKLLAAQDAEIRRDSAAVLGRLRIASAAAPLRECAAKESDILVQANCYKSLGLLKDEGSIALLATAVANKKPTPAIEAAGALYAIGTTDARAALEELAKQKLSEDVLEAVNKALDDLDLRK
jgi:HEAT repeat protein